MSTALDSPIRLIVHGAAGRMSSRVIALAKADARFVVVAAPRRDDRIESLSEAADCVVDFSSDSGAARAANIAQHCGCAVLTGTTALSEDTIRSLRSLAREHPVLMAPNTSLGVAVTAHIAAFAARVLGPSFDLNIIETHHNKKRDAPSGTALRLRDAIRQQAARTIDDDHMHAVRSGDVIGEHTVEFGGPGERITITHQATNRDLFARGALEAAAWLVNQPPGNYTMEQALRIEATYDAPV